MPFDHPSASDIPATLNPSHRDSARMQLDSTFAVNPARIIIQGVTSAGRAFRPSDWAERLCGVMSTFGGDNQMRYSPYVRPVMLDGVRCVVVEPSLAQIEPRAYRFLIDFARDNELVVIDPNSTPEDDFCPVPGALESLR